MELGSWDWLARNGWVELGGWISLREKGGWNRVGGFRIVGLELDGGNLVGRTWLLEVGGWNWVCGTAR